MDRAELEKEKSRTRRAIHKKLKRINKGIVEKEQALQESDKYPLYEHYGNLLKSNFHLVKPRMDAITVTDYANSDVDVVIKLDPKLSPQEQLKFYFQKSKKLKKSKEPLTKALAFMQREYTLWQEKLAALNAIETFEVLVVFQKQNMLCKMAKKEDKKDRNKPDPVHRFFSEKGFEILVGKSAEANDELTFQMARGEDLWLHAHGVAGSHVVIRKKNTVEFDEATILDAAQLCLYFSKARQRPNQLHEVVITERKYVSRIKGAPKGKVQISHYKIIKIALDVHKISLIKSRH